MSDLSGRMDDLETRVAYQERTIEELNGVVTEQWKQIEALTRRLSRMEDRLTEAEASVGALAPNDGPPPHY